MKSSIAIVAAFAVAAMAQDLGDCGQKCVNNMLDLAQSLGCSKSDGACLCKNANFANGLRDCANEACGAQVAPAVIAYGTSYCSSATAGAATGSGANTGAAASTTGAQSGAPAPTGGAAPGAQGNGTGEGGSGSSSAITTSPIVTLVTSGSAVETSTVGESTIYGAGGVGGVGGAGASGASATSGASGAHPSETGSASGSGGAGGSTGAGGAGAGTPTASSSSGGEGGSSSSKAGAAQQTAFPGMVAAVGLAALLL